MRPCCMVAWNLGSSNFGYILPYIGYTLPSSMCSVEDLGLPELVVHLLQEKSQSKSTNLKFKIIVDSDYAQLTLTWLPTGNKTSQPQTPKPKGYRKKAPCEIQRDKMRRQKYLDKKNEDGTKRTVQDVSAIRDSGVKTKIDISSVCGVKTRSMAKNSSCESIEGPRENVEENDCGFNSNFISPEKCDSISLNSTPVSPGLLNASLQSVSSDLQDYTSTDQHELVTVSEAKPSAMSSELDQNVTVSSGVETNAKECHGIGKKDILDAFKEMSKNMRQELSISLNDCANFKIS